MATRHNYHCTITLAQLFQIIPDIYLTGRGGTLGCALWFDGPRHITVPILILLPGLCNTGYGTVNLKQVPNITYARVKTGVLSSRNSKRLSSSSS